MRNLERIQPARPALVWSLTLVLFASLCVTLTPVQAWGQESAAADSLGVHERLVEEAQAVAPLMKSTLAKRLLEASSSLPVISEPRVLYTNAETREVLSEAEAAELSEEELSGFEAKERDGEFYYYTGYGTPLAAVHAYDLVAQQTLPPANELRILEFGYGSIGQLRLLASLGAEVTGIEVSKTLRALYSYPGDTGKIAAAAVEGAKAGYLKLIDGHFPGDSAVMSQISGSYDIFLSKNTLKRGYIHPEAEVDPRMLVHLGVDDTTFVETVHRLLKPGGYFMIYNLCPKYTPPDADKYIPWSDGRCPFDRELIEKSGFEVIEYNRDDTEFAHTMAKAFGWDSMMDLENDLYGVYTLLRRK